MLLENAHAPPEATEVDPRVWHGRECQSAVMRVTASATKKAAANSYELIRVRLLK
jgi:hypothetical protein